MIVDSGLGAGFATRGTGGVHCADLYKVIGSHRIEGGMVNDGVL